MKILLTGASGQLGRECENLLKKSYEVVAPKKEDIDIRSWDKVITGIDQLLPDLILNCAAFTDVDKCESEKDTAEAVNVEGTRNLAQGASRYGKSITHISSHFVFNGKKRLPQPYFEDDPMRPISFYGLTKMESEMAVKQNATKYTIIRSGWLYNSKGKNFLKKIIKEALKRKNKPINVVSDQCGSPTWSYSLAHQIKLLIDNEKYGIYHATSEGYCSRYEWAKYILDKMEIRTPILPCSSKEFPQAAQRPINCILENRQLKIEGINIMTEWKNDLDIFIEKYGDSLIEEIEQNAG